LAAIKPGRADCRERDAPSPASELHDLGGDGGHSPAAELHDLRLEDLLRMQTFDFPILLGDRVREVSFQVQIRREARSY
jgi:hypothetical protein